MTNNNIRIVPDRVWQTSNVVIKTTRDNGRIARTEVEQYIQGQFHGPDNDAQVPPLATIPRKISEQPTKLREPSNNPQQGKIYRVTKIIIDRIEEFDDAPLDFEVAMNPVHVDANQYARSLPLSFLPALPLPLHPAPPPSFQPPSNATRSTFVEPTSIQTHSASTQYGEQGPQTESRAPQEARHATSEDPAERQTQVVANNRKAKLSRRERRAQREERARLLNRVTSGRVEKSEVETAQSAESRVDSMAKVEEEFAKIKKESEEETEDPNLWEY
ncbi:MAG: hypothetical protein LQ352_007446 [Teloschistes flavicans]|nr:MAG: hypothetical protein LQ352_007446 [Teloschistes flavicans]